MEALEQAIAELQDKIDASTNKTIREEYAEDVAELAVLRRAKNALTVTEGSRAAAAAWLRDQALTVVNPKEYVAAATWLEHLKD